MKEQNMLKEIFVQQFRKLLQVTIINKEKLIEELESKKKSETFLISEDYFNVGIDKAIEIIRSK